MFIFLFIYTYLLMFNYFDVPKISETHDYIFGFEQFKVNTKFIWSISFSDHVIGNLENIIILLCMMWGMMRGIDVVFFLEKYKND